MLWGTKAEEIKVPSAKNPKLLEVPSVRPAVGQNIALRALSAARNSFFLLPALVHSNSVLSSPLPT